MKKPDPLKAQLDALHALGAQPRGAATTAALRKALEHKSGFVVAAAADLITELEIDALTVVLREAFQRCLQDPLRTDKGCKGKNAIAAALHRLDRDEPALFIQGLRHRQPEPVWGGSVDTAVELRGTCALGLARSLRHDALAVVGELAELLADPEWGARAAAARALGCCGQPAAGPVLRFKALLGDSEPQVLTECLAALVAVEGEAALALAERLLGHAQDEVALAAALALGQSRLGAAWPLLRRFTEDPRATLLPSLADAAERRRVGYLALSMLRLPAATEHLMSLLREAPAAQAAQVVAALALQRYDGALRARVEQELDQRKSAVLREAFAKAFAE